MLASITFLMVSSAPITMGITSVLIDRGPIACNLRQRVVLTSMFNWPRGSHSLLLLGVSFPVVLYSCMVW